MNNKLLENSLEENNRIIDRLFEMFGINPDELEKYVIQSGKYPYVIKYNNETGYSLITDNPKTVHIIEAIVTLKEGLNDALSEEIENKSLKLGKDNL